MYFPRLIVKAARCGDGILGIMRIYSLKEIVGDLWQLFEADPAIPVRVGSQPIHWGCFVAGVASCVTYFRLLSTGLR